MKYNSITTIFVSVVCPYVHVISREAPQGYGYCWYEKSVLKKTRN